MATTATRRLASTAVAAFVLVPSGLLLAAPAFADDPAPTPTAGIGEAISTEAPEPPLPDTVVATPDADGNISGGTLQESTGSKPAVRPAVRPQRRTSSGTRTTTTHRSTTPVRTARTTVPSVSDATVLPFTGTSRLTLQLTVGGALVLAGAVVTVAARPRL